jgi:serine O-acetyltransferase
MRQSFRETLSLIKADMKFRSQYEKKKFNFIQCVKFFFNPLIASSNIYRIQQFFYTNHMSIIGAIFRGLNSFIFTVNIHPHTTIGSGFLILHANFIVIGPNVKIGKNCILAHHNSITPSIFCTPDAPSTAIGPTIGDNVVIGGGAVISGELILGNDVKVSMCSAVQQSFGDGTTLFGVPAKSITKTKV